MTIGDKAYALEYEKATGKKCLPPLSQSRYEDLACETLYAAKHISHLPDADSEAARRGTAIHAILAGYVNHLVKTGQQTDYAFLDELAENAPLNVLEVLEKIRESYTFEPKNVLATEMHIVLDSDFSPTTDPDRVVYEGTLDLALLPTMTEAEIHDWKSYYQIVDADTFQSKFYPLLLMCVVPSIERVKFVLEFVRYGATREVTYMRDDLPKLKRMAIAANARKNALHAKAWENEVRTSRALPIVPMNASPGRHCMWCPLLTNGCPLAQTNPYASMKPEERVSFAIWLKEAAKQNNAVLKNVMVEGGPVSYRDDNGVEYRSEFVAQKQRSYPLNAGSAQLTLWMDKHPEDTAFTGGLTISGLSSPLKAKKRDGLKKAMEAIAETSIATKMRIGEASGEADE